MKIKNEYIAFGILLLFFLIVFGLTGFKLALGISLLYILPFYLILDYFDLDKTEKIIFSFFISIGIFPTFVYYIGILFNSIRISIIVTFVLFLSIGLGLKRLKRK